MTGLLLDSHVALWLLEGRGLRPEVLDRVADPTEDVWLSVVTPWELAIKQSRGRLRVREDYIETLLDQGVKLLGIEVGHTRAVRDLPEHHRDPFDRMLVAQAQVERLTLVTRDEQIRQYDVKVLAA